MVELKFRPLRADEVDVRAKRVTAKSVMLLLYKDARCDMNILDETVGPLNWKRSHSRDNANCTVSLWDREKCQWIGKEDTGTESNTEAEKGLASDSFKRACVNWGIGRELYTSPSIWVDGQFCEIVQTNAGYKCNTEFQVAEMVVENGRITSLKIADKKGKIVWPTKCAKSGEKSTYEIAKEILAQKGLCVKAVNEYCERTHVGKEECWKVICEAIGKASKDFWLDDWKAALKIVEGWS